MITRVAVVDENEIFRRGLVTCLRDAALDVASVWSEPPGAADAAIVSAAVDVAVVSSAAARSSELACALVICGNPPLEGCGSGRMLALLPRNGLTSAQLVAAVQGAAAGLRVACEWQATPSLDQRRLHILCLLADGASTHEISLRLRYSERTIKGLVASIEDELGSRTRAQAVAMAIRGGLI